MVTNPPDRYTGDVTMNDLTTPETDVAGVTANPPKRGSRQMLAALVLAGALGIVGAGSVFAADESTGASASPAASDSVDTGGSTDSSTEGGTESDATGEDCPERTNDESTEESSS
jgi:hypothetical protein